MKILLRATARYGKQLDPRDERDYKVEVSGVVELKLPAFGTVVVFLTMLAEKDRHISYITISHRMRSYNNHIDKGL